MTKNMNSTIKILIVTAILSSSGSVLAQSGTSNPVQNTRAQIKDARVETRAEIQDARQDLASTTRAVMTQASLNIEDRMNNRLEKMFERFEATIDRLTNIMNRLNTRIEKIKTNGGNTTEAEKLTASAKIHLDMAKNALTILKTQAETQSNMENSSTSIKDLRNGMEAMKKSGKEIEKHLREAHKELQKSIGVLRGMSQLRPATTTNTN
jgi:exonuclease VII small subunit